MAHHGRTPQSVLDAPKLAPTTLDIEETIHTAPLGRLPRFSPHAVASGGPVQDLPPRPAAQELAATKADLRREQRRADARVRREQQRADRIAADTDRATIRARRSTSKRAPGRIRALNAILGRD